MIVYIFMKEGDFVNSITKEELEQIFKKYMELPYNEVGQYLNKIATQKSISVGELNKLIEEAAKLAGIAEYERYLIRKKQIKSHNYLYVKVINDLLDKMEKNEELDFSALKNRKMGYEEAIESYMNVFPEKKEQLNYLLERIKHYFLVENKICKFREVFKPDEELSKKNLKVKYICEIVDILNCQNEMEAITYMRNLRYSKSYFENIIANFRAKYINSDDYIPRLEYLFEKYLEFIKSNNDELNALLAARKKYFEDNLSIVKDLLSSECSIEEYCHKNYEINIKELEKSIKIVFNNKSKDITLLKEKNSSEAFINEIKSIAFKIDLGNYDIIDYYMDTKLSFLDFASVCKKYGVYSNEIAKFVSQYRQKEIRFNLRSELECSRMIKGRTITKEEKVSIFRFLTENEMPINVSTYNTSISKYLNGEIDIESKTYTKKI